MRSQVVAQPDAFWLKAETRNTPSRWAFGLELATQASPLSLDELRAHIDERISAVPWAFWRVHGRGRRPGRYHWVATAAPALDDLVVHERLLAGDSLDGFLGRVITEPLDRRRPLWRLRLLDRADGRQSIVFDGHHAFAGGYVVLEMLDAFFGSPRTTVAPSMELPAAVPITEQLVDIAWTAAAAARRVALRIRPGAPWAPARAGAPLVGPIALGRRVAHRVLPLHRVEAIAVAHGASVTRTVVALVSRALDGLVAPGTGPIRVLYPHGTQEGPVTRPGNAARSTFLDLPTHLPAVERLAALKEAMARNATQGPQPPAIADLTLTFLAPVPDLTMGSRAVTEITASVPLRVCSRPLTRLSVFVAKYRDTVCVAFTADEASLGAQIEAVADDLLLALDEFLPKTADRSPNAAKFHQKIQPAATFPHA